MDYKALVGRCRENLRKHGGATTVDVAALCDAVEALERDRERLDAITTYFIHTKWADSFPDERPVDEEGFATERYITRDSFRAMLDRLRERYIASFRAPTASASPTLAAPSDA